MRMIEIKGFIKTSMVDWDGKVTSVIFLPNCNFRCPMCHNHELILNPSKYQSISISDIKRYLEMHSDFIDGVVITGGEPTMHKDLSSLIKQFRDMGFQIKLDTNGSFPNVIRNLVEKELVDYVAMDVKAPLTDGKYKKVAGVDVEISRIRESVDYLMKSGIEYEFRTTVVPTLHTEEDIIEIAREIEGAKKFVLQKFEPKNAMDEKLRKLKPHDASYLKQLAEKCKCFVSKIKVRA